MTKGELKYIIKEYIEEELYSINIEELDSVYNECIEFNAIMESINLGDITFNVLDENNVNDKLNKIKDTIKKKANDVLNAIKELIKKFNIWINNMVTKAKTGNKDDNVIVWFYPFNINSKKMEDGKETITIINNPESIELTCRKFITMGKDLENITNITFDKDNAGDDESKIDDSRIDSEIGSIKNANKFLNEERKIIENLGITNFNEDMYKWYIVLLSNCTKLTHALAKSFKIPNAYKYKYYDRNSSGWLNHYEK